MLVCSAVLCAGLCGCSKTIDGSSREDFERSIEEVGESLDDARRKRFNEALSLIATHIAIDATLKDKNPMEVLRRELDGLTAAGVIARAEELGPATVPGIPGELPIPEMPQDEASDPDV
jgi:hypothetical protein